MKLATNEQLISLIPTDEAACRSVPRALLHSVPGIGPEWLRDGVKNGSYKCTTVQFDGVEAYQLYWHKNLQHVLVINAAISLTNRDEFPMLLKAGRQLMRQEGCRGIEFCTKRRGLVEKLLKHGGSIVGITCYIE